MEELATCIIQSINCSISPGVAADANCLLQLVSSVSHVASGLDWELRVPGECSHS